MALKKAQLEEINQGLQSELRRLRGVEQENERLRQENASLSESLTSITERLQQLEAHYNQLRDYVIAHTGES